MSEKPVQQAQVQPPVSISEDAKAHFVQALDKIDGEAKGMRLTVTTKGCSGYKYEMQPVFEIDTRDMAYPISESYRFFVAVDAFKFVAGTQVQLQKEGLNARIVFENPNAEDLCGCGESFSLK